MAVTALLAPLDEQRDAVKRWRAAVGLLNVGEEAERVRSKLAEAEAELEKSRMEVRRLGDVNGELEARGRAIAEELERAKEETVRVRAENGQLRTLLRGYEQAQASSSKSEATSKALEDVARLEAQVAKLQAVIKRPSPDELHAFLVSKRCEQYEETFREQDVVTKDELSVLTEDDLKEMGLPVGARRRLFSVARV